MLLLSLLGCVRVLLIVIGRQATAAAAAAAAVDVGNSATRVRVSASALASAAAARIGLCVSAACSPKQAATTNSDGGKCLLLLLLPHLAPALLRAPSAHKTHARSLSRTQAGGRSPVTNAPSATGARFSRTSSERRSDCCFRAAACTLSARRDSIAGAHTTSISHKHDLQCNEPKLGSDAAAAAAAADDDDDDYEQQQRWNSRTDDAILSS